MLLKYRYEEFTWPEIREAVARKSRGVLPVGTVEQHGPHLPLVTDVLTATEMSRMAVERMPGEAILMPPVYYSFNEHHMDFPGTIAVEGETIVNYVTDIGKSLAHHGFRKILLVNGHGSNVPFLDIAARNITNQTEAICAMVPWWSLIPQELLQELRESEFPGGMAHGCELETSVLLHLRGDLVQFEKAKKDINFQSDGILLLGPGSRRRPCSSRNGSAGIPRPEPWAIPPRPRAKKGASLSRRWWSGW